MKTTAFRPSNVSKDQRRRVAKRVRTALEPHQPRNYRLILDEETLEKHGDDWLMVVRPDREDVPLGDSVRRMMAAEEELRTRWKLNISLLPALPPEDD